MQTIKKEGQKVASPHYNDTNIIAISVVLAQALEYAQMGMHVIPLHSINEAGGCTCNNPNCGSKAGKHPIISDWVNKASIDKSVIQKWWTDYPFANVGILTGLKSGVFVVDVDPRNGGDTSLQILEDDHERLPDTVESATGGGGRHLFYKYPLVKLKGQLALGVDIKSDGGYVVTAPSLHSSGSKYEWLHGQAITELPVSEAPQWLLDKIVSQKEPVIIAEPPVESSNDYPEASAGLVKERCAFIQHCVRDAETLSEVDWYHMITILCRTTEAPSIVHEWSKNYPSYDYAEAEYKIQHALKDTKPVLCSTIQVKCSLEYCESCRFQGHINSPIRLGQSKRRKQLMDFPIDSFPEVFKQYINHSSNTIRTCPDFPALALLVFAGGLIGNAVKLALTPTWIVPALVYAAIVGEPSTKKSPAIKPIKSIIDEFQDEMTSIYNQQKDTYNKQVESYKLELENWKYKKKEVLKAGKVDFQEEPPKEPIKQFLRRLYTSDTTTEGLLKKLSENYRGLIIFVDELSKLFNSFNQYKQGKGSDRSTLLEFWNNGTIYIDRASQEEPIIIKDSFVNIIGGIQPSVLKKFFAGADYEDGLKERFLFAFPHFKPDGIVSRDIIPEFVITNLKHCLKNLFNINCRKTPEIIELSDEAQVVFDQFHMETQEMIDNLIYPKQMEAYVVKMREYTGRIALILHCVEQTATMGTFGNDLYEEEDYDAVF